MDNCRPVVGWLCVVIISLALGMAPPYAAAAGASGKGRSAKKAAPKLTLPEAVSIALTRNLQMADSRLAVQEKEHQRREAFSDFFPTIDLQYVGDWDRYKQSSNIGAFAAAHDSRWSTRVTGPGQTSTNTYPYRIDPYRSFTFTATITQPLYTGGKLLSDYKYARLGVDYSAIQYQVDRQDLTLEVYEAFYELIQSEKLLWVAEESIKALEGLRNQMLEFYKAGVSPKVDVLSAEGQLATARIQRTQALTDIDRYKATLNYLLRYPQETPIEVTQDIEFRANNYRIPDIYAAAAANRLEIRQANISVEQAMELVKSSKADVLPSVAVKAQAYRINDDWNPFDREAINDWSVQGVLTWTFDMFRNRETVKERRATQARAFVNRELLVEQIMEEVKTSYLDMKRSEANIIDNRKAVEYRKENFRINQERYKEQVATYIEVLDAQRQLASAQGDYYTSLVNYRINQAVLERRMGIIR